MKGHRILIIGSPGSGKSTFARKLRDSSGLPLYYLDMIHHKADRTQVDQQTFDDELAKILMKREWIIDGNYARTLEWRLTYADTVFLFDLPLEVCLQGIRERRGKKREDLPWIEQAEDEEFMAYIRAFPREQLPHIYELLDRYKNGKQIIIFHDRQESQTWLDQNM